MRTHKHVHRLEQWSVVKVRLTITIDEVFARIIQGQIMSMCQWEHFIE